MTRNPSLAAQQTPSGEKYLKRIRSMNPYQRLFHWITERHAIHCRRFPKALGSHSFANYITAQDSGAYQDDCQTCRPWTDDPILQTIFFCNPYRENDKVTAYLRNNFREKHRNEKCVFLGTILLRWFNYIPTMRVFIAEGIPQHMGENSNKTRLKALDDAQAILSEIRAKGEQLFSGAYIIKLFNGVGKLEAIMQVMKSLVLADGPGVGVLTQEIKSSTMAQASARLRQFDGMGLFYIYQFICDLAYTHLLPQKSTPDWMTWSFCGPGTSRGLHRLQSRDTKPDGTPWERMLAIPRGADQMLLDLQVRLNEDLAKYNKKLPNDQKLPPLHMRDITNCLCEYDKYCRALNNERDLKRGYHGQ